MSVYTSLTIDEAKQWLTNYDIGDVVSLSPIQEGTINSNYFVETKTSKYVLTLCEQGESKSINDILELTIYLAKHNLHTPVPLTARDKSILGTLKNRPTTLINAIPGNNAATPNLHKIRNIANWLGQMHIVCQNYPKKLFNFENQNWRESMAKKLLPVLSPSRATLLQRSMEKIRSIPTDMMPTGIIHADLFIDNVLFDGDDVAGVIDFYMSCTGMLLYDLAIIYENWCLDSDMKIISEYQQILFDTYQQHRPLSQIEIENWENMLTLTATRFWMGRLKIIHFPEPGSMITRKPPEFFEQLLLNIENGLYRF